MAASNDATGHTVHFVIFGAPALVMAGLVGFQELRGRRRAQPDPSAATAAPPWEASWQWVAGGSTTAAALTHAFVIPEHFKESLLYGVFFVVLMAAQSALGVMLVRRPSRKLFQRVGLGSLAVIGLYSQGYLLSKALRPERVTAILGRLTDDNHPAPTLQTVSGAWRG